MLTGPFWDVTPVRGFNIGTLSHFRPHNRRKTCLACWNEASTTLLVRGDFSSQIPSSSNADFIQGDRTKHLVGRKCLKILPNLKEIMIHISLSRCFRPNQYHEPLKLCLLGRLWDIQDGKCCCPFVPGSVNGFWHCSFRTMLYWI